MYYTNGRFKVRRAQQWHVKVLQFWTLSAFFRLGDVDVFDATASLFGQGNLLCRQTYLNGLEDSTFFECPGVFEVILLSESRFPICKREDWSV